MDTPPILAGSSDAIYAMKGERRGRGSVYLTMAWGRGQALAYLIEEVVILVRDQLQLTVTARRQCRVHRRKQVSKELNEHRNGSSSDLEGLGPGVVVVV